VRRVPVGRNFTSIDVLDSVFCIPLATARLLRWPGTGTTTSASASNASSLGWGEEGYSDSTGSSSGDAL